MSSRSTAQRRRRSEFEDEEEGDDASDVVRSSQRSTPSSGKRVRTNRNTPSESGSEEGEGADDFPSTNQIRRSLSEDRVDGSDYQPGALVRVKLFNFITYAEAEFFPGPNLNMIIGPNGTGKSSLVCAICLGLGWSPKHLGRAGEVGEFVKNGANSAYIEVELQRRNSDEQNYVVGVKIIRDGNGREWSLNGKKTTLKAIRSLTHSLSIQIDNLCQFLPQDKVSEFAGLTPVELLQQTQRAAAPEHMLIWHDKLKQSRKTQKQLEQQLDLDREQLGSLEDRRNNLRAEVETLEEIQRIEKKVRLMKKTLPFLEYVQASDNFRQLRDERDDAKRRLSELRKVREPSLRSFNLKQDYSKRIQLSVAERKRLLVAAEKAAGNSARDLEKCDEDIRAAETAIKAERDEMKGSKTIIQQKQRDLQSKKARLNDEPIDFDSAEYNEKVRLKNAEGRDIDRRIQEFNSNKDNLNRRAKGVREEMESAKQELNTFDSQEGQQLNKIERASPDTAKAWKWVQEHRDEFEQEIYGPALTSCSVKDARYAHVVEHLVSRTDVLAITAQTRSDFKKLNQRLLHDLKLADITLRMYDEPLARVRRQPPLSPQQTSALGIDGWAIDLLDGPDTVLAMLCGSARVDVSAVMLKEPSDEQYNQIAQSGCQSWVTPSNGFRLVHRREYGAHAKSTTAKVVQNARFWTDAPVDMSARGEIEVRIAGLKRQFDELRAENDTLKDGLPELQLKKATLEDEVTQMKNEKNEKQRAHGEQKALPGRIERLEEEITALAQRGRTFHDNISKFNGQWDVAVVRKAKKSLEYKDKIEALRACHGGVLEAEIRLIEATSDVESLSERNRGIVEQLENMEQVFRDKEQEAKKARDEAKRLMNIITQIKAEVTESGELEYFQDMQQDGITVENRQAEIEAEENRLKYMHAGNPNAIRDFESFERKIAGLSEKITSATEKFEHISGKITKMRDRWEPELDKLVSEISDAFSHNFEQIGCAGEVGIHKDEDFEQWAIQIKVKFRENETLQLLDQHRQSGGERSVSTIFYLMSLQSLARAPFRVVDEINQGMDPRNERLVHERMVEIACKEHTSQYFLITPKLLTNLRFDPRMKVHCIYSGEHMPRDHRQLDVRKIIARRIAIKAAS